MKRVFSLLVSIIFMITSLPMNAFAFGQTEDTAQTIENQQMNTIPIAMASDKNYIYPTIVAMTSVLENKKPNTKIDFYIMLSGDVEQDYKDKILNLQKKYSNCKITLLDMKDKMKDFYEIRHVTAATYYRLMLPSLLPHLDKVLYLDVDIIVKKDLNELFNYDLTDYYIAGVLDTVTSGIGVLNWRLHSSGSQDIYMQKYGSDIFKKSYINAGITLFNLKNMRKDNIEPKLLDCVQSHKLICQDQCALNLICYGKILTIPSIYNIACYHNYGSKQVIVHYIGSKKPWISQKRKNASLWWEYAQKTDYFKDIQQKYMPTEPNTNYGVLCYEYNTCYGKEYSYNPKEVNLGDYIQSLAAIQYLPKVSKGSYTLIDRDSGNQYKEPRAKMIMNGWFFINPKSAVVSEQIEPLYVSFHINNPKDVSPETIEHLKKHEPIGCRDYQTKRFLDKNGVKTYFSGCLTTTLDIDYKVPESERTNEIIFCDYKMGTYPQADNYLKSLKNYDFSKAEFVTHNFTKKSTHEERFEEAKRLLNKYARAKLVVTSRIHCALPCLALGTPVIFIKKDYDVKRFDGLYSLLNTIGKDKNKNFKTNVKKDDAGNVINSDDYLKYRSELIKKCSNFTKLCGAGENK